MPLPAPRLPGIRFEVVEPPRDDLPRMDIAVFVGFAASGPLNLPVAVEDMAEYAAIFGGELPLAFDPDLGTHVSAYLPHAVRAFFRNGGRRCWVIRVAGVSATTNRFRLPGLRLPTEDGALAEAWAEARSPGSWSDDVHATTVLRAEPLAWHETRPRRQPVLEPGTRRQPRLEAAVSGLRDVAAGDLLRVTFDPRFLAADEPLGFLLAVDGVAPSPSDSSPIDAPDVDIAGAVWVAGDAWFFRSDPLASPLAATLASPLAADDTDDTEPPPGEIWQSAAWISDRVEIETIAFPADAPLAAERLTFDLIARERGKPALRVGGLGFAPGHPRFWAALPSDARLLRPSDQPKITHEDDAEPDTAPGPLWNAAATPRFPLCGRAAPRQIYLPIGMSAADAAELGAPVQYASPSVPPTGGSAVTYAAASERTEPRLERDGLGRFSTDLFLDPKLAAIGSDRLLAEGAFYRYEAPATRRLEGIHAALLELEEASLIAVPDAVHRCWEVVPQPPDVSWAELPGDPTAPIVCAPSLMEPPHAAEPSPRGALARPRLVAPTTVEVRAANDGQTASYRLSWSAVSGVDIGYALQEAGRPDFVGGRQIYAGPQTASAITGRNGGPWFYRVRALGTSAVSPWSRTIEVRADTRGSATWEPGGAFADCHLLPAPGWQEPPITDHSTADSPLASYDVRWTEIPGADAGYTLEEATRDDFADGRPVYEGPDREFPVVGKPEGIAYYRVRAHGATATSDWSRTLRVRVAPVESSLLHPWSSQNDDELITLHQTVLRLCAAKSDIFAVLTLPAHHREDAALAHADRLASAPDGRTLSFGALYHPWLVGRGGEVTGEPRALPPDGAVTGQIARRTLVSGAWLAPANEPFNDVLSLEPAIAPARWLDLQEAGVNVIRHEPRGFLLLSAYTLERGGEVRPINVRRLLILLRRLALRRGARYVFEPNDAAFRRLVQRGFEATLDDLFVRGAFAGDTPENAYQVDTGPGLNTPQSVDAGRFIVELRVAPSRPLSFLIVRLVQTGDRALVVLER